MTPSFLGLTVDQYAEIVGLGAVVALGAHMTRNVLTKKEKGAEDESQGDGGGEKPSEPKSEAPAVA